VSTTGTDSDFIVKLIDVYPDDTPDVDAAHGEIRMGGYQQLVRGELFRGKFRNSFTSPEPFVPGKITKIEYQMPDIFHTFRKGHRIMVLGKAAGSWSIATSQFLDIYNAKASDFKKATQRLYRSGSAPSFVKLNEIR
jgi:predicted acyl esterase